MGNSSSSGRRRNNNSHQNPSPSPRLISSYAPRPPSSSSTPPPPPANYVFAANAPYTSPTYPSETPYPAPHPPPHYQYNNNCPYPQSNYQPHYYANHYNGLHGVRPPAPPPLVSPPYVEHQKAKKIRNDVNVHKDTIKLEVDEKNPEYRLVSFNFDAVVDGSITVFYFAKEGVDCTFMPVYPDAHMPVKYPFEKGLGQKFRQPSGTGIDLGFFQLDDISKPSPREDVFPIVIFAETCSPLPPASEQLHQPLRTTYHAQITQAVIHKNNGGSFQVKVIKQILWIGSVRYELREIYGIGASTEAGFDDSDPGKECVICMTEPKDTAVLPCRHMCMCSECAKALRRQTNKCPICRQPIEEFIEIKVNKNDQ